MTIFHLPDLGEGLAEAEIHEWFVKEGDEVKIDQPLVSMETAKAVVEVPSPQAGKITKLYGKKGDIIQTHAPLIAFEGETDKGTVVGKLEQSDTVINESDVIIGTNKNTTTTVKAMPAVRALAKQLNVDLAVIQGTGANGQITAEDVKKEAGLTAKSKSVETLHGVRRAMATIMTQSHQEVVPVTIVDDADITGIAKNVDFTVCLLQAIITAVKAEPALNAWYDGKTLERCVHQEVNIGLAMDTEEGLFVPVIKNAENKSPTELRKTIDELKKSVRSRTVPPSDLQGATITLSNFGTIAGRYATPIIVPPMVAILACGKMREEVVARQGKMEIRNIMPLSLTFDHRAVTGGEAARFLGEIIKQLQK